MFFTFIKAVGIIYICLWIAVFGLVGLAWLIKQIRDIKNLSSYQG